MTLDKATLVLNADFQAVAIVPVQRAIVLVYLKRAEIVKTDGTVAHSQRVEVAVPAVIALREYVHVPHSRRVPVTRRNVLARDSHVCAYCNDVATTVDHIVPRAHGGQHRWKNVAASCRPCNGRKAARTPEEAKMPLLIKPYEPKGHGALVVLIGHVDPLWDEYLTDRERVPAGI